MHSINNFINGVNAFTSAIIFLYFLIVYLNNHPDYKEKIQIYYKQLEDIYKHIYETNNPLLLHYYDTEKEEEEGKSNTEQKKELEEQELKEQQKEEIYENKYLEKYKNFPNEYNFSEEELNLKDETYKKLKTEYETNKSK